MVWYVALGSAVGGVSRFLLATLIQQRAGTQFPIATLLINITGSGLLGFLLRFSLQTSAVSPNIRALLTTGFCGGYTTFSTYSYETAALIEEGEHGRALLYVLLSVGGALIGTFLGIIAAREIFALRERP